MPKQGRELMLTWLRDAYAMERALEKVLDRQADHAENNVDATAAVMIRQHREETARHAEDIRACLQRHGEDVSKIKAGMGVLAGLVQGMGSAPAGDTVIKDCLAGIASEHFEIAAYRSLIVAAEQLGDADTAATCRMILRDEEAMAAWLESQLPRITQQELVGVA
jgi:ferritin-like metal-binding protein YciE